MKSIPPFILLFMALGISCDTNSLYEEEIVLQSELAEKTKTELTLSTAETALHDLINNHRQSIGLSALTFSMEAYHYAADHNAYMISQGILSHDGFNKRASGISRDFRADFVGENVAKDYASPETALEGWLESTSHKGTIEGDFTHTTLSIAYDAEDNPYYTQIFFRLQN